MVQLRGEGEDEGGDHLALAGRCLLPPSFLSISPLSPGLSLSSPSSSVPGICCLQTKMAVWKGCSTNTASSPLFQLSLFCRLLLFCFGLFPCSSSFFFSFCVFLGLVRTLYFVFCLRSLLPVPLFFSLPGSVITPLFSSFFFPRAWPFLSSVSSVGRGEGGAPELLVSFSVAFSGLPLPFTHWSLGFNFLQI